jgi:hypothetical protein
MAPGVALPERNFTGKICAIVECEINGRGFKQELAIEVN